MFEIITAEYYDKSDKNFKNLYRPYREEKNDKRKEGKVKFYYRVGKARFPLVD